MRRKLIAKTKERSVEEILFDPQAWDYNVAWGYVGRGESEIALSIYNSINDSLANNTGFIEELIYTRGSLNFYIIYPTELKEPSDSNYLPIKLAYSLILGYFIIEESGRKFKFYGSPQTLYHIIKNIYLIGFPFIVTEDDGCAGLLYYVLIMIEFNIIDYFQRYSNIKRGFCCKGCKCRLDENSFSAIVESNPEIESFIEEKFINCPNCGSKIPMDKNKKEMLNSYEIIYKNQCFTKQGFGSEFQIKFISNLLFNKSESDFLRNLEIEKISDPLCRELFGISKSELNRLWCFFEKDIQYQVYDAVDKFIFYENIQDHADYIESKRVEALRYLRRKKLKSLAKIRRNQNDNSQTEYTSE